MAQYTPRRAGKRWLDGAPPYVLDCFDHPQFADRYTIWFGADMAFHTRADGSIGIGPDRLANTYITGIGTSETGSTSGALEYAAPDVAAYRYRNGHKRIAWRDLPAVTRALVELFATE